MKKRNVKFDPAMVAQRIAETRGLAIHMATRYARRYPLIVLDDLVQECLGCITRAAQLYKNRKKGPPFNAFALMCLKQCCWAYVKKHGRRKPELTFSHVLRMKDDAPYTVADKVDDERAREELTTAPGEDRHLAMIAHMKELIETLPSLTPRERQILKMQYLQNKSVQEISHHLGRSLPIISTESARAIRKLRAAIPGALSPSAPVVGLGTGRPVNS